MKYFILIILFLLSVTSFTSLSYAQSNSNLYVSAENTLFENHFAGPMVIEVIIDDSDISSLTGTVQEPNVTVDDNKLSMVQADDGKWYGYFADKTQAQKADSLVGLAGYGLDFGEMCSNFSTITGLSLLETSGFTIPRDISSSSNGQESFVTCTGNVSSSDQLINNVVREAPTLNTQSNSTGQTGIDQDVWPLIQLFDIDSGDDVIVKYDKGSTQSVELTFDTVDQFATLTLAKTFYRPGENVTLDVTDAMLNIDPTDEDSWTWATISGSDGLFYQLFDEDGAHDADGTSGAVNINDGQNFEILMFEDNGSLLLNPNSQSATNVVTILQDNDYTVLEDKYTSDSTIDLATDTIPHIDYPITLTESASNSGSFVNYDKDGVTNLIINPEAETNRSALIEYNKESFSIFVKEGSPPTALDFSENISKDMSISFTVITEDTDLNGDTLFVTITDFDDLDGSAVVNSDNTITFTPDSGFIGTTSFEYTIDDVVDGKDTGIITVTVDSAAILASINQITVNSDESTYVIGDMIDTDWIIPSDSSGTDTTLRVISPIGTNAVNEILSSGTDYSITTDNFVEGTYTIRIEHGQYYGETSVLFVISDDAVDDSTDEDVVEDTPVESVIDDQNDSNSCSDNSKLSVTLDETSYTKGDEISVSTEICDVISNEYVIVQIFDPFNAQLTIDQFLPTGTDFYKEYSTEGGLWKLDGKHSIKSTYLGESVESSFNFVLPSEEISEEIPVPILTDSIASFVDSDKDPSYYVDRYHNEESYKEWFDTNYSQYDSIYDAVGIDESTYSTLISKTDDTPVSSLSTTNVKSVSEVKIPTCGTGTTLVNGLCQVVKSTNEPTCGTGTTLVNGLCQVVKSTNEPTCGTGTTLVNGLCQVVSTDKKSTQENNLFDNVFGFFKTWFN